MDAWTGRHSVAEFIISPVATSNDIILAATETDLERDEMWLTVSTRQPLGSSECWLSAGSGRVDIRLEHFSLYTHTRPGSHLGLRSRLDLAPKRLESRLSHHLMTRLD